MTVKDEVAAWISNALAPHLPVLVVRGADEAARDGGDIDLVVPLGLSRRATVLIAERANLEGWAVVGFRTIGYIEQLCLIRYPATCCADAAIKIDVWNGLSWQSLGQDVLGNAVRKLVAAGEKDRAAAIATWFQKMLYAGYLRPRDRERIFSAVDVDGIANTCSACALPVSQVEIEDGRISRIVRWRLRAASAGVGGWRLLPWFMHAALVALQFQLRLGTSGGQVVGVAGMDGSGKSTVVDRFCCAIEASEFTRPIIVHLLPDVIPTLHQLIRRTKTVESYMKPYAEPPVRSHLNATLRLGYYVGAFLAARCWTGIKVARGETVVFDRSVLDFASDLARARIPHVHLPGWLVRLLLPKGMFVYICASPEAIVARKDELTLERAKDLGARYDRIAELMKIDRLAGNQDADRVFSEFLGAVSAHTVCRIRKVAR